MHLAKDLRLDVGPRKRRALGADDIEGCVRNVQQDLVLEIFAGESAHVSATQLVHPGHGLVIEVGLGSSGPLFGEVSEAPALLGSSGSEGGCLAEFENFHVGRSAVVIIFELGDEAILRTNDGGRALRELIHKTR